VSQEISDGSSRDCQEEVSLDDVSTVITNSHSEDLVQSMANRMRKQFGRDQRLTDLVNFVERINLALGHLSEND
jgi:hypothetical protein